MICGALQTLNEEAFEDVVASERPSPTGGTSTGEKIALENHSQHQLQQSHQLLTPIQEIMEQDRSLAYSQAGTADRYQLHTIDIKTDMNINNNNNNIIGNSDNNNKNINTADSNGRGNVKSNNLYGTQLYLNQQNSLPLTHLAYQANISNSSPSSHVHKQTLIHSNENKSTIISVTSSSPSSVILMPSNASSDTMSVVDDTHL